MAGSDEAALRGGVADPGPLAAQETRQVSSWQPTLNGNPLGRETPLPPPQRATLAERVGDALR